jgi:hypothetical protein
LAIPPIPGYVHDHSSQSALYYSTIPSETLKFHSVKVTQIMESILGLGKSQDFLHYPELLNFFRIQMVFENLNRDRGFRFGCQHKPKNKKSQNTVISGAYLKESALRNIEVCLTLSQTYRFGLPFQHPPYIGLGGFAYPASENYGYPIR